MQNVAEFVSKSRRASTQKVHNAKWVIHNPVGVIERSLIQAQPLVLA